MALRCRSFRKNLSAFLDGEVSFDKREQMGSHISECAGCRREAEKMREMIGIMNSMAQPETPAQLWEATRWKLLTSLEAPARTFRIPRWGFVSAGAIVFALLLFFLGSQTLYKYRTEPALFNVYLQEHALSYSEQILPPDLLSELTIAQTEQVSENTQSDESMSELEMLMEVHYGIDPTDGS